MGLLTDAYALGPRFPVPPERMSRGYAAGTKRVSDKLQMRVDTAARWLRGRGFDVQGGPVYTTLPGVSTIGPQGRPGATFTNRGHALEGWQNPTGMVGEQSAIALPSAEVADPRVYLHELLHARSKVSAYATPQSRALEEGLTEANTRRLVQPYVSATFGKTLSSHFPANRFVGDLAGTQGYDPQIGAVMGLAQSAVKAGIGPRSVPGFLTWMQNLSDDQRQAVVNRVGARVGRPVEIPPITGPNARGRGPTGHQR